MADQLVLSERDKLIAAAKDYRVAYLAKKDDKALQELEGKKIALDMKYSTDAFALQQEFEKASEEYSKRMTAARQIITNNILESKAGLTLGRVEAIYKKGKPSTKYKGLSDDLVAALARETDKETANDIYEELKPRHTNTGDPKVEIKIV